jgi:hypothetical protein
MARQLQQMAGRCWMNYSFVQFPRQNNRVIHAKAFPSWIDSYGAQDDLPGSRFDDDRSEFAGFRLPDQINWGALSGIGLSLALSAACWAGIALVVERFLK